MSYEDVLKSKLADYCQQLDLAGPKVDIRNAIQHFLVENSIKISDPERLQALEYQVRAELSRRVLESHLRHGRSV